MNTHHRREIGTHLETSHKRFFHVFASFSYSRKTLAFHAWIECIKLTFQVFRLLKVLCSDHTSNRTTSRAIPWSGIWSRSGPLLSKELNLYCYTVLLLILTAGQPDHRTTLQCLLFFSLKLRKNMTWYYSESHHWPMRILIQQKSTSNFWCLSYLRFEEVWTISWLWSAITRIKTELSQG